MNTNSILVALTMFGASVSTGLSQPAILLQPQSRTNLAETTAVFSVAATGSPPLSYQWQKSSAPTIFNDLPNRTNATLVLTKVSFVDAASYRIVIHNDDGSITSEPASLVVLYPPRIAGFTPSSYFAEGADATLRLTVTGTMPLSYRWFFNDAELANAATSTLLLINLDLARSGDYFAVVSNAAGAVTSRVARVKAFSPARHGIGNIAVTSGRPVELTLAGETTATFGQYFDLYPLQVSSNLVDWAPLATVVRTNAEIAPLSFHDSDAAKVPLRFYRTPTNAYITPDPKPTGPYPVGSTSRLITDPSRTNKLRHTAWQFMVTVWYPTVAQTQIFPTVYTDWQIAQRHGSYSRFADQMAQFSSHSLSNAPLAPGKVKYPIVLYSPGATNDRRDNTDKAEELASWGYIVVGMDHRDTSISVFPDGSVVIGFWDNSDVEAARRNINDRVLDAQAVLDEMARWNTIDPAFAGRMDLEKIGVLGYSLGGGTAAELARLDHRCRASVDIDGVFFKAELLHEPLSCPFLLLRASDGPDPDPSFVDNGVNYDDRKKIFDRLTANAYWVKLAGTVHQSFGDFALIWDPVTFRGDFGVPQLNLQVPGLRVSQIVRAYLVSFFNKHLAALDDHLLDGPSPDYPEVIEFVKK